MRAAPHVRLSVAPLKPEYDLAEPLFLRLGVQNVGPGTVTVPRGVDPSDGYLRLRIRMPGGRVTYYVTAELSGVDGSGVAFSDPVAIDVRPPAPQIAKFARAVRDNPRMLEALYLRHPLSDRQAWRQLEAAILESGLDRNAANTTEAYFRYVEALGWLTPFAQYRSRADLTADLDRAAGKMKLVDPSGLPASVQQRQEALSGTVAHKPEKAISLPHRGLLPLLPKERARAEVPPAGLFGGLALDRPKKTPSRPLSPFVRVVDGYRALRRFADVVSWNIEHLNWQSNWHKIPDIAELIRSFRCDFWGVQEITGDALEELVEQLNSTGSVRYDCRYVAGSRQQSGCIFRTDTTSVHQLPLPEGFFADEIEVEKTDGTKLTKKPFLRDPLLVDVRVKHGASKAFDFRCAVVHLKSTDWNYKDKGNSMREAAATELARWIQHEQQSSSERDYIVLGDMNAEQASQGLSGFLDDPDLKLLSVGMQDKYDDALTRVASRRFLDHIVVTSDTAEYMPDKDRDEQIVIRSDRRLADFTTDYSDHVPVAVRFVIGEDAD